MLTAREAVASLYGAWRLARFDPGGMTFFDTSIGGFWRSFYAAVIVAPFYMVLLAMRYATGTVEAAVPRFVSIETIAYVIAWFAFPLVMLSIVRVLDREAHYLGYIVAYNWAAVLQNALYLPLAMLAVAQVMPHGLASGLGMVALSAILLYTWFVTRTALAVSTVAAVGVVVLDLVLSIFINGVAEGML